MVFLPNGHGFPESNAFQCHTGVRSYLPLRGSPRFPLGSLLASHLEMRGFGLANFVPNAPIGVPPIAEWVEVGKGIPNGTAHFVKLAVGVINVPRLGSVQA